MASPPEDTRRTEREHRFVRENCGHFSLGQHSLVFAEGVDLFSYLQSQTTNDVLALKVGEGQENAIVSRKANLLGTFSIHKISDNSAWILTESAQKEALISTLDANRFREKISWETEPNLDSPLTLQGPKSLIVLNRLLDAKIEPMDSNALLKLEFNGQEVIVVNKNMTGEEGYLICSAKKTMVQLKQGLKKLEEEELSLEIGPEAVEILRLEAGIPLFGLDMNEKMLLPETGLEHRAVSYSKGCYTGQEVIARIKTYGAPSFALMGILFDNEIEIPFDSELIMGAKKIGFVKSSVRSLSLGKNIALAYIQKDHRSPDQKLSVTINERKAVIQTALLPFYQTVSNFDRAKLLHEKAMSLYKNQDNLDQPISLLREAITLAPKFALAYEALGVLLSKQNKLDEAISLMKRLIEIDPTEIMAHSNLSIYYMQQGRIEDAENEKAEATAIQFEKMIEESQMKKAKEKQEKAQKEEQVRQKAMFEEVLKIDPIDQVANFGLGSIYFNDKNYEAALAPLESVVKNFPDHSASYLLLGKALEKLKRHEEALNVYKEGIARASKKGDLMPLREMQSRQRQISQLSNS